MTTHFTSDTHFFHKNIIEHSKRPFVDMEEMHEALIDNWNKEVKRGDDIYHLGDFSFGNEEKTKSIISRLNGNKHLIYGNHDQVIKKSKMLQSMFNECVDYKELDFQDNNFPRGQLKIVLFHFPLMTWNKSHYSSLHLHGHCHGGMKYPWKSKILDAGVDVHNFRPISLEYVLEHMKDTQKIN